MSGSKALYKDRSLLPVSSLSAFKVEAETLRVFPIHLKSIDPSRFDPSILDRCLFLSPLGGQFPLCRGFYFQTLSRLYELVQRSDSDRFSLSPIVGALYYPTFVGT